MRGARASGATTAPTPGTGRRELQLTGTTAGHVESAEKLSAESARGCVLTHDNWVMAFELTGAPVGTAGVPYDCRVRIVIPGGTGQVGNAARPGVPRDGHEVVVLGRDAAAGALAGGALGSRGRRRPWAAELDGADVVINLAGRSVNCRYTPANRREIIESRVQSDARRGQAIARARSRRACGCRRAPPRSTPTPTTPPTTRPRAVIGGHEPGAPDTWRFSIEVATRLGAGAGRGGGPRHPQGEAAIGDDHEPRRRRHLRHLAGAGAPGAGRHRRRRAPVRVLDPRDGLRAGDPAA